MNHRLVATYFRLQQIKRNKREIWNTGNGWRCCVWSCQTNCHCDDNDFPIVPLPKRFVDQPDTPLPGREWKCAYEVGSVRDTFRCLAMTQPGLLWNPLV